MPIKKTIPKMPTEPQWIKGYEGLYKIANDGTVYSHIGNNVSTIRQFVKNTYLFVTLNKNGKRKDKRVHRLVAEAFVYNPFPRKYRVVMHIDDDRLNPHYTNLKWGTPLHNTRDMDRKGRRVTTPANLNKANK